VPTVGQVVAVVDAQLGSGLLRCLGPGCGRRLARWGFGVERDVVGLGGVVGLAAIGFDTAIGAVANVWDVTLLEIIGSEVIPAVADL
jgi:hypothetical protein